MGHCTLHFVFVQNIFLRIVNFLISLTQIIRVTLFARIPLGQASLEPAPNFSWGKLIKPGLPQENVNLLFYTF